MKRLTFVTALLVAAIVAAPTVALVAATQARSADPIADATPPFGSVQVPKAVNTTAVALVLKLYDPASGVVAVRASNDGATFGDWTAMPSPAPGTSYSRLPWTLSDGDGPKTVTVEARNGSGLMGTFTASTVLDTVAPAFVSSEPAGGAALAAPPAGLTLHFSEPIAPSPLPVASMPGGPGLLVTVAGADVAVKPRAPIVPGAAYSLTVSGARDPAGNTAEPVTVEFTVDPGTPTLKVAATPATILYGTSTLISGSLNLPGASVTLYRMTAGESAFTQIATATVSAKGRFSFHLQPLANTRYGVEYAGNEHWLAAAAEVGVKVKPRVRLAASPAEFLLKGQTVLKGRVTPAHPGATVIVQRKVDGRWTDWQTLSADADSRFSFTWKPTSYGIRHFRAWVGADADHAAGLSPSTRVVVDNPNPHHISVLFRHFIVIDISECHLYYYESGRVVRIFDVVLGKPSTPTPRGQWAVYSKSVNPGGPFGAYAMFYYRGYGIHGTNQEYLLSLWPRYFSHGCCRLYNWAITWLYPHCPIGTPVRNVY